MSAQGPYKVTEQFEEALCAYTGAPFAIALDSCSSGLLMALVYAGAKGKTIALPNRTYMSVPNAVIHAGGSVQWTLIEGETLTGAYRLAPTCVIDSALRFTAGMYEPGTHTCISFSGPNKHLKLGKGGAILTDDPVAAAWFKRARFSGRNEVSYHNDTFEQLGWNCYMMPQVSALGLLLIQQFYRDGKPLDNPDLTLPYPDLSKFPVYTRQP